MSEASSLPYKLRPNKAVDREIFLSYLNRLNGTLNIDEYTYIGLGGPFLEDFRLLHARVGIQKMVCIEMDENVHKRQLFNKPFASIDCVWSKIEDYIRETDFDLPVIIWLDFNDPRKIQNQIELFSNLLIELPIYSIVRITLNANPSSLGIPKPEELVHNHPDGSINSNAVNEWRLERFKQRYSAFYPASLVANQMSQENYGKTILDALRLASEKSILNTTDRKLLWSFSTHYADGQAMVTSTAITLGLENLNIQEVLNKWQFFSSPKEPHVIDLPALSTIERLTLELDEDAIDKLGFELPSSRLKVEPFDSFRKYYRVFPHFARVDL